MYRDLDHVEKCGFLHGVQHVSNNIIEVFLDVANFCPFLLHFMGILKKKFLKLFQMEQISFNLIEQASELSKITRYHIREDGKSKKIKDNMKEGGKEMNIEGRKLL